MINKSLRKLLNLKKLSKIPQAMFYKRPTDLEAKTYYKIANLYEN